MRYHRLVWVSILATFFLFLPSMAIKLWEFITGAPWPQKSWLVYLFLVVAVVQGVRLRRRFRKNRPNIDSNDTLIFLAKQRLVRGELSIEEFRQIREELRQS